MTNWESKLHFHINEIISQAVQPDSTTRNDNREEQGYVQRNSNPKATKMQ